VKHTAVFASRGESLRWFLDTHGALGTVAFMASVPAALYATVHVAAGLWKCLGTRPLGWAVVAVATAGTGALFGTFVAAVSAWNVGGGYDQSYLDVGFGTFGCLAFGLLARPTKKAE
jgi:hypothetical protein